MYRNFGPHVIIHFESCVFIIVCVVITVGDHLRLRNLGLYGIL
jgi:hypothetical protein